jgi:hypothetical protein
MTTVPLRWRARPVPLAPRALLARDQAARALARRLLAEDDAGLASLRACTADATLVVLAEEARLPWVDGAVYLGHDPAAPALLMPTHREPGVPADLFVEALEARLGRGPWAVVPSDGGLVAVPLAAAGPVSRARLEAWSGR